MAKDGLNKVIEGEINNDDYFQSIKEEYKMETKRILLKGLSYAYSPDPFYLSATDCGWELQPGEKCVMKMKYHPEKTGGDSTSLKITSNDPDEPTVVVDLQGRGFVLIVLPN